MSGAGLGYSVQDPRATFSTYLAATKILAPKTDGGTAVTEADTATTAGSVWADQMDDFFDDVNQIFTGNASILGPLMVDPANDVVAGDADGGADDGIFGNNSAATASGITILNTSGIGKVAFGDALDADVGRIEYDHSANDLSFWTSGTEYMTLSSAGSLTLGAASPSITVGSGVGGSGIINMEKEAAGTTQIRFRTAGLIDWIIQNTATEAFAIQRYNADVSQDTAFSIANATGDVTIANDLVQSAASPTHKIGDGTTVGSSPVIQFQKETTGDAHVWFYVGTSASSGSKDITHDSSEHLKIRHHNGSTWDDAIDITDADTILFPGSGAGTVTLTIDGELDLDGDLNHDGSNVGFYGTTPAGQSAAYTRNATAVEDRVLLASASATTTNNNNVLAALIADLQAVGLIG